MYQGFIRRGQAKYHDTPVGVFATDWPRIGRKPALHRVYGLGGPLS
jgi:hypothetical protein